MDRDAASSAVQADLHFQSHRKSATHQIRLNGGNWSGKSTASLTARAETSARLDPRFSMSASKRQLNPDRMVRLCHTSIAPVREILAYYGPFPEVIDI